MGFFGADTAQLREQSGRYERCGRAMIERTSSLTAAVMTVAWAGNDADELRHRWTELERRLQSAADDFSARATQLSEHAEEQDRVSDADGGDSGRSLLDRFGLPDLSALLDDSASRLSDWIGNARSLADAVAGPGGGLGNPLAAAMAPGGGGSGASSPEGIADFIDSLFGSGDTNTDSEDSPFTHTPGTDTSEKYVTIESEDGTKIKVSEQDGTVTHQFTKPHMLEVPLGDDGNGVTLRSGTSNTYEVQVNPDGSLKYTFTHAVENGVTASGGGKGLGGSGDRSTSDSVTYSVDVPAGTSVAEALKINPYDSSSIPRNSTVTIDTSHDRTTAVDAQVDTRTLPPLVLGGESSDGEGTSTVIARGEDGTLSVTAGPTASESDSAYAGIGTKDLNFSLGTSRDSSSATLEHAEFAGTPEGDEAFSEAVRTGRMPDGDSSAVTERYTETREDTTSRKGLNLHLDSVDIGRSHNDFASERITRDYGNGRTEWDEQILPAGIDNGSWARASGGSDRETNYQIHMVTDDSAVLSDVEDYYGHRPSGPVDLSFTESELDQARANSNAKTSSDFSNNSDYAAGIVARSQNQSVNMAVKDVNNDYTNFEPGPDGGTQDSDEVPGRLHR